MGGKGRVLRLLARGRTLNTDGDNPHFFTLLFDSIVATHSWDTLPLTRCAVCPSFPARQRTVFTPYSLLIPRLSASSKLFLRPDPFPALFVCRFTRLTLII